MTIDQYDTVRTKIIKTKRSLRCDIPTLLSVIKDEYDVQLSKDEYEDIMEFREEFTSEEDEYGCVTLDKESFQIALLTSIGGEDVFMSKNKVLDIYSKIV